MKRLFGSAIVALCLTRMALAGQITITGEDIVWSADQIASPQHVFKVKSDTGTDILLAWQLILVIVPDANATGTLQFKSVSLLPDSLIPDLYSSGSPLPSGTTGALGGAWWPGVTVPAMWANLIGVDFEASADAGGRFDIAVLPGTADAPGSLWADNNFLEVAFGNVPFAGGPVVVGSVLIDNGDAMVPEPAAGTSALLASLLLVAVRIVRRRRIRGDR